MKIGIVIGSIREVRLGEIVGRWVADAAGQRTDAEFELIDLRDFEVPLLTSGTNPARANREYGSAEVRRWSAAVDSCDGFIFVTPEYNHGVPGAFKNAVDSLAPEWMDKAVGFVSYGSDNGVRAVEQWRQIVANFRMVDVRAQVSLSIFTEFGDDRSLQPSSHRGADLTALLDQIVAETALRRAARDAVA